MISNIILKLKMRFPESRVVVTTFTITRSDFFALYSLHYLRLSISNYDIFFSRAILSVIGGFGPKKVIPRIPN